MGEKDGQRLISHGITRKHTEMSTHHTLLTVFVLIEWRVDVG
jgi:hypothetical protein